MTNLGPRATLPGPFSDLTWSCHFCTRVRPDEKIDVAAKDYLWGLLPIRETRRYCNDSVSCCDAVARWRLEPPMIGPRPDPAPPVDRAPLTWL